MRIAKSSGNTRVSISTGDTSETAEVMVYFQHGSNSTCRIGTVGPTGAIRPLEMSTGWGSNNIPIIVRRFSGSNVWSSEIANSRVTLLDSNNNTTILNALTVGTTTTNNKRQ